MKLKIMAKGAIAVIAAMALQITARADENGVRESDSASVFRTPSAEAVWQSKIALLSTVMASNCTSVTKVMTPSARQDWVSFLQALKTGEKQYFLPDFCKVRYPLVGGHDDNGCLFGFFNPFYNAFMLFIVDSGDKARISGFRFVRTAELSGKKDVKKEFSYPLASGVTPCADYFKVMLAEMTYARVHFHAAFSNDRFRSRFAALALKDSQTLEDMQAVLKKRIGQVVDMSAGPEFSKVVLSRAVLEKGKAGATGFIAQDETTTKVLAALSGNANCIRKDFTVTAHFSDGGLSNFVFANLQLQSVMVQAIVNKDKRVSLRMFDMSQVGANR